jgi:hypothetical protein
LTDPMTLASSGRSTGWSIPTPYGLKPSPRKRRESGMRLERRPRRSSITAAPPCPAYVPSPISTCKLVWPTSITGCCSSNRSPSSATTTLVIRAFPGKRCTRTHLAHIVVYQGEHWLNGLRFRDRLRSDANLRAAYEALKMRLAADPANTRAACTAGKTEFVGNASRLP